MGTTAQKLAYTAQAKADIKTAIESKGVTVGDIPFGDYAGKINLLSGGKFGSLVARSITTVTADDLAGVTKIGEYAFNYCVKLTSIILPDGIVSIGAYAFENCTVLSGELIIPNSVNSIGNNAFKNNYSLTKVVIGSGIQSIGAASFNSDRLVTEIIIHATTPPTLSSDNAFLGSYPIYVPAASVTAYQSATNWASLASRIQAIPS